MSGKLRQRSLLAIVIYFLMITAIWTPIGFYAGVARGESEARPASGDSAYLSQPETIAMRPGEDESVPHVMAPQTGALTAPLPRAPRTSNAPRHDASLRQNPLRESVLRSLSGESTADGGEDLSPPVNLALAPEPPALGAINGDSGGASAPNGYPGAIIPGFLFEADDPGTDPPGEDNDPPVLVTPIPTALPLLLTGLAFLGFTARRRRKF